MGQVHEPKGPKGPKRRECAMKITFKRTREAIGNVANFLKEANPLWCNALKNVGNELLTVEPTCLKFCDDPLRKLLQRQQPSAIR
jgi:hypothetical protein